MKKIDELSQIILFHLFLEVDITGEIWIVRMYNIENNPRIPNSKQF